jgi:hypothetical protein
MMWMVIYFERFAIVVPVPLTDAVVAPDASCWSRVDFVLQPLHCGGLSIDLLCRSQDWLGLTKVLSATRFRLIFAVTSMTITGKHGVVQCLLPQLGRVCHDVWHSALLG